MPVISMVGPKLTKEQKKELITRFTDTAIQVTKIPRQAFIVTIQELEDDSMSLGGETVEAIKARLNINN